MFAGGFFFPVIFLLTFYWLTKRSLESRTQYFDSRYYVFSASYRTGVSKTTKAVSIANESNNESGESVKFKKASNQKVVSDRKETNQGENVKSKTDLDNAQFSFKKRQIKVLRTILLHITFFCIGK
jgi:hypothetical protein